MGYTVKFESGHTVSFETKPSQADIDEVYSQISKTPVKQPTQPTNQQLPGAEAIPGQVSRPAEADPYTEASKLGVARAVGEAAANTAAGLVGSTVTGPLAFATNALNRGYRNLTGQGTEGLPSMEEAFNQGSQLVTQPLEDITSPLGKEYTGKVGAAMNEALPGLMHLHTMHVEGAGVIDPKTAWAMKKKGAIAAPETPNAVVSNLQDLVNKKKQAEQPAPVATTPEVTGEQKSLQAYRKAQEELAQRQREQQLAQQSAFSDPNAPVEPHPNELTRQNEAQAAIEARNAETEQQLNQTLAEQNQPKLDALGQAFGEFDQLGRDQQRAQAANTDQAAQLQRMRLEKEAETNAANEAARKAAEDAQKAPLNETPEQRQARLQDEMNQRVSAEQQKQALEQGRAQASNLTNPGGEHPIVAEQRMQEQIRQAHEQAVAEQQRLQAAEDAVKARQKAIEDEVAGKTTDQSRAWEIEQDRLLQQRKANGELSKNAFLRKKQEAADVYSRKERRAQELARQKEEAAKQAADIAKRRAENEALIQRLRDEHSASEARAAEAQRTAQEALDKRTEQQRIDTQTQTNLDMNAAERARQEQAPLPPEVIHPQPKKIPLGSKQRKVATALAKKSQRGVIDPDLLGVGAIHDFIKNHLEKFSKGVSNLATALYDHFNNPAEIKRQYLERRFDATGAIGDMPNPAQTVERSLASGATDIPINARSIISANLQSGANFIASKFRENPLMKAVAETFNVALGKTNYYLTNMVTPVTKAFSRLNMREMNLTNDILKMESVERMTFSTEELRAAGMSDKAIHAYEMMRKAYDHSFELQNEQLKKMGQPEITKADYYYASRWKGDYSVPVYKDRIGADGKPVLDEATGKPKQDLVWFVRTETRGEGRKALKYLKENFPELNIDENTHQKFKRDYTNAHTPTDVASAYRDMMEYFKDDPDTTAKLREAMEGYIGDKSISSLGQNKHFMEKAGIRGFQGDTPWLSKEESSRKGIEAQIDYLKNAARWAHTQEAVANIKQMISDPRMTGRNDVAMAQKLLDRELGLYSTASDFIESTLAQMLGKSRGSSLRMIGSTKSLMYLQTLGVNGAYSLATALQGVVTGPFNHLLLASRNGYSAGLTGAIKTIGLGLTDATAGIMAHMAHEMKLTGAEAKLSELGMSKLGQEALKYMEDSGYVKRNVLDESRQLGGAFPALEIPKNALSWSISQPERIARISTFMSFVHHLEASGEFVGNRKALFHEAELWSDRTLGSFKSFDRPMAIDKAGAFGDIGYVYQSYKFTTIHQLNTAAREAARGNVAPLMALFLSYQVLTGVMNTPGAKEMDGMINFTKDFIAKHLPSMYTPELRDFDLRQTVLSALPKTKLLREVTAQDIGTNGVLGQMTGVSLGQHISPQVMDAERPSANLPGSVFAQELKEWGSMGEFALHPNKQGLANMLYKNAPPSLKGMLEQAEWTGIKRKSSSGDRNVYLNPNKMPSVAETLPYTRTQNDEAYRRYGANSIREGNLKETWFRNNSEEARISNALKGNIEGINSAVAFNRPDDIKKYAVAYLKLDPDGSKLNEVFNNLDKNDMSQEERKLANLRNLRTTQAIMRFRGAVK